MKREKRIEMEEINKNRVRELGLSSPSSVQSVINYTILMLKKITEDDQIIANEELVLSSLKENKKNGNKNEKQIESTNASLEEKKKIENNNLNSYETMASILRDFKKEIEEKINNKDKIANKD